jgi:hypothetical protein
MARLLRWWLGVGVCLGLGLSFGVGAGAGCAAGGSSRATGSGGAGGESSGTGNGGPTSSGTGNVDFDAGNQEGGIDPDAACAKFSAEAQQAPAAMLIVLDASASMTKQSKWGTAQLSVVGAIDKDVFDTMSLGLTVFPSSLVDPPTCLCQGLDPATCKAIIGGVSCGFSFLPQVPIAAAGKDKSNAPTGVRRQIYDWLANHQPLSNQDDGSPIYDALKAGYETLKAQPIDRRILLLITDGGFSCTSVASPARPGYQDLNGCPDWEYPDSVNTLIKGAHDDASKPIYTFVVGVPGSNSTGAKLDGFDTPPYNMLLALSTYAVSGAQESVDPACSKDAVFTQNGAAPAKPCHMDLSNGAAFNADALAKAISDIRGKALGCIYDLPPPPQGQSIDPGQVNVNESLDGNTVGLKKRTDMADTCAADGCWDYTKDGKVELLGKACTDLGAAKSAKVDILVGCATVLK